MPGARRWPALAALVLTTGCASPGEIEGTFAGTPFELRSTRLFQQPGRLSIHAREKVTACRQRLQSGRAFDLDLRFAVSRPPLGYYPLIRPTEPTPTGLHARAERITTDEQCVVHDVVAAESGGIHLVAFTEDPRTEAVEVEVAFTLTFADGQVEGRLFAETCVGTSDWYCDVPP